MYTWSICDKIIESPHVLVAGCTGSGKSVMLNSMIMSIVNGYSQLYLIDLKRVELKRYRDIVNTLGIATEPEEVIPLLDRVIDHMEDRYKVMEGVKSTDRHVYVVVDELADLITQKGVLDRLIKIGRLGRAANIHLLCATQDPSRKTLPAALMQNFTSTVALRCRSAIESRQIIGIKGAESLPQYGFAYLWDARGVRKIEVPFTPEEDIDEMVEAMRSENPIKETDASDSVDWSKVASVASGTARVAGKMLGGFLELTGIIYRIGNH